MTRPVYRAVSIVAPGSVVLEEEPPPTPEAGQVSVATLFSGISAGTELTAYRGSNPYLHKRWNPELRLFEPSDRPSTPYPIRTVGYEEVGRVIGVGREVTGIETGDLVYGAWGHREVAVLDGEYARARLLPAGLEPLHGIFSHIGSVALNGLHDAAVRIGETAVIFGLGVLGQIIGRLATLAGATVIGVDPDSYRRRFALETGSVAHALDPGAGSVGRQVKEESGGRGADVVIEVSGSTAALNEAIRCATYSGRVVTMGFYQGGADALRLGEEFHHNRVSLICSQISGVAPELSGRWSRERLAHTVMRLQAEGRLDLRSLVTHTFPLERAAEAYRLLDEGTTPLMQVVLKFDGGAGLAGDRA